MGTGRPHVEITAATLAGGEKNQDRYAYGDGWAFVLDGASSFVKAQPEHDGGWYAERLKQALIRELTLRSDDVTTHIVARAIEAAAAAHNDPQTCPTSTIALARWADETIEAYVLGDSTVALIEAEGETVLTDTRLTDIGKSIRAEYHSQLAEGCGFGHRHRELLQQLQASQASARNRPDGYWIAGAHADAALHGLAQSYQSASTHALVLVTDGVASGMQYGVFPTWEAFSASEPQDIFQKVSAVEESDPKAAKWPRSKLHDDKTAIIIRFPQSTISDYGDL